MADARHLIGWALLGGLAAVTGGAAALGVALSPTYAPLVGAATNTLSAANYSEVLVQSQAGQGSQTAHYVFQRGRVISRSRGRVVRAPDRIRWYTESGGNRTYYYVIGSTGYQSVPAPAGVPLARLTFLRQAAQDAVQYDPAHGYLPYATEAHDPTKAGGTYSFSLTKRGQTGHFTFTVDSRYVTRFTFTVPNGSARLHISDVGTSPPVRLPAGARVITAPSGTSG